MSRGSPGCPRIFCRAQTPCLSSQCSAMQSTNRRRQALGKQERQRVETIIKKRREANIGASDLEGFQAALVRKHGNILRAWKEVLDVDGIGHLCFTPFCKACRDT